jgi:hypothetical protein
MVPSIHPIGPGEVRDDGEGTCRDVMELKGHTLCED